MLPTIDNIISLLNSSQTNWLRVNEEVCLHRYFDKYYILLCLWYDPDLKQEVIYIEVDDIDCKKENVLEGTYPSSSENFKKLQPIYRNAYDKAIPAKRHKAS